MVDKSKYVVLDLETNGTSSREDDLLSISIYKPDDGKIFNKFLPLEKASKINTTEFNGITLETLKGATPLTQIEMDDLINEFDIKNRTVLTYGDLDKTFFKSYCNQKNIKGFDKFHFFNFKENIFSSSFQGGNITKDNLCRLYGIDNIKKVHSGINDCILEWKLFEKMNMNRLIVISNNVYVYSDNYIIPVSYVTYYKRLRKHISTPRVAYRIKPICKQNFDKNRICRFLSNASGIAIEHVINSMLDVKVADSSKQLCENLSKLKYIGTLPTVYNEISVSKNSDGTLTAINKEDNKKIELINKVSIYIKETIGDFISKIKTDIFKNENILSQELIINKEHNLLALCDLSNEHAVVEIKTSNEIDINKFALQLYIQSNSRPVYLMYMDWENPSINLAKVEFSFNEEADKINNQNKNKKLLKEKNDLQKKFFDKKDLKLTVYKGKTCVSEFKCKKCGKTFKMKKPLTYDFANYLQCPYCNPSEYSLLEKKDPLMDYWKIRYSLEKEKNIKITNWVYKSKVYVKCQNCGYEWCDNIKNILKNPCPKCAGKMF